MIVHLIFHNYLFVQLNNNWRGSNEQKNSKRGEADSHPWRN